MMMVVLVLMACRRLDGKRTPEPTFKNPRVGNLFTKWRQVWLMAMERRRKLQDALDRLNEVCLVTLCCSRFVVKQMSE